eukprot:6663722-Pyramimonas_sp.AAC.1
MHRDYMHATPNATPRVPPRLCVATHVGVGRKRQDWFVLISNMIGLLRSGVLSAPFPLLAQQDP